ncbi:MAG: deoxyribonuclease IV [Gemmatimonadales bacterium]|nr:deoxyribonuclease IV [Gemmatimonadales bacterium]NIN50696.1 deoxyribonuclease IV [Gemmatimonadales bacterium]NIP08160.1 deoxyribonuclease IV [Gemmatimonadales bacterium]NIR01038.1 deoxyribonuclease IV [Gemmatimonadales bacterium]NIS65117.1 deoxyribonuclease IV [Gemmatimonadales bacterium]
MLGAHVSTAGGVALAPTRGAEIGATAIQIFTKTPNQWREPRLTRHDVAAFQAELARTKIRAVVSHDSYLINLASPNAALRTRSIACFKGELRRCRDLGIPFVVTHPGHYIDDRKTGLDRNAKAYALCLAAVEGPTVLIETTAGSGTALGSTFEELAELRQQVPQDLRGRVAFCADTCHLHAAGYDLSGDWDGVWEDWAAIVGMEHLRCVHLNDSQTRLGSRRDRHAWIGEGTMGPEPFRRSMRDPRFRDVIKIIETPKGEDPPRHDRRMLRRLRGYATVRPQRSSLPSDVRRSGIRDASV